MSGYVYIFVGKDKTIGVGSCLFVCFLVSGETFWFF